MLAKARKGYVSKVNIPSTSGVRGGGSDTTVVVSVTGHPDVTRLAPGVTPAVLHDPIVRGARCSVSDSEDSVVQLAGRASSLVVNSRGVQLEGVVAGIDGNRHWLLGNS